MFYKDYVVKNFSKLAGKDVHQSFFFNTAAGFNDTKKETPV